MQPLDSTAAQPDPRELLTLGQEEHYRRYYSDNSQAKAYFGFECEVLESEFLMPRIQFVHAVDNGSVEYTQLRALGYECLYDDGQGRPPTLLQNFVESSEEFKQLARLIDPATAQAEGW